MTRFIARICASYLSRQAGKRLETTLRPYTPSDAHKKAWETRRKSIDRVAKINADPLMREVLVAKKRPDWKFINGMNERQIARLALWNGGYRNCCYCGVKLQKDDASSRDNYATVEHIVPVMLGGSSKLDNLTMACQTCNNNRGNMVNQTVRSVRIKLAALGVIETVA